MIENVDGVKQKFHAILLFAQFDLVPLPSTEVAMLTALTGTFRNGRVELDEDPGIVGEAPVVVTFLSSEPGRSSVTEAKVMTFGMLADPMRKMSSLDDFKVAEYDEATWDRGQTP